MKISPDYCGIFENGEVAPLIAVEFRGDINQQQDKRLKSNSSKVVTYCEFCAAQSVAKNSKIVLFASLLFAGSMWFYVQRILVPFQNADAKIHGRPRGNLSDLYPRWLGARELLLHIAIRIPLK